MFSRALGAARSGKLDAARADVKRLEALKEALVAGKNTYWAAQTDFQLTTANAWIALWPSSAADEALKLMRAATEAEEGSDKHPVTPGNVAPSRELLGEMLLELV